MTKVITYGTYDMLHYGHVRLLKRAKALGDYLVVGVTADDFDKARGKIDVKQSLIDRIDAVRKTGLADEIIVEEYEGQKIDDIKRLNIDIFTVGSDWIGKFDYLNDYCKVVYLDRTDGISSSSLRNNLNQLSIGLVGESNIINKFVSECSFINGISISGIYTLDRNWMDERILDSDSIVGSYDELLERSDAVYIASHPSMHFEQIKQALNCNKHVLCESPISISTDEYNELSRIAIERGLVLSDGIKTAYSIAYERLLLLLKTGIIGDILSVDITCTSLRYEKYGSNFDIIWPAICSWGPTGMLPVFHILGADYKTY